MTVQELIARLSELPNLPVVIPSDEKPGEFFEVEMALVDTVAMVGGVLQLCHDNEEGAQIAIRLFGPETDFTAFEPSDD
jgi:hypothetical protein